MGSMDTESQQNGTVASPTLSAVKQSSLSDEWMGVSRYNNSHALQPPPCSFTYISTVYEYTILMKLFT